MIDHEPNADELTERARQLTAEAAHLHSMTKRRHETVLFARDEAVKITGEAASPDDAVRATVDVGGMLTKLVLSPDALRDDPEGLADSITAVTQQAAARARAAVRELYTPLRDEGIVRDMPILLPEPAQAAAPPRRHRAERFDEEPFYDEAPSVIRSEER